MNLLYKTTLSLILMGIAFLGGWFAHMKTQAPEIRIETRKEIVWRDRVVYRDYNTITRDDCINQLQCYDTAKPTLDIAPLSDNFFRLSAGLCERSWTRDVSLSVGESGNWKYYIGAGVIVGAGISYMLLR
jgi:hypothetical protein